MQTYIVQVGDNIASIAKMFNIKVADLVKENNLENIYYLIPGLELIIPTTPTENKFDYYKVEKGDNLYQIAKKYGITAKTLAELNGLELNEYIFPDQQLLVPKEGLEVYITKDGDTLNSISNQLNTSRDKLISYNENIYLLPEQLIVYRK